MILITEDKEVNVMIADSVCNFPLCTGHAVREKFCFRHAKYFAGPKEKKAVKPIAKKSKSKIAVDKELKRLVEIYLARPENKYCNIQIDKNCKILANVVNHKKRRGRDEILNEDTWEPSCDYCNGEIENKDAWAREHGHLTSKFSV